MAKRKRRYKPGRNPTGVDGAGRPVSPPQARELRSDDVEFVGSGVEYSEIAPEVRERVAELLGKLRRRTP